MTRRFSLRRRLAGYGTLIALAVVARATADDEFTTINDFGGVGLLQTPTARIADEGEFGVGISRVKPYDQIQIFAAPLPWLETTLRYTDITNRLYGPQDVSGNQTYKDRSFGVKLRLLMEGEYLPELAVGIQDLGGTGVFSSEYLIASRRYYDFDFSLGLGWGRLGAGGSIRNPFAAISSHFDQSRQVTDSNDSTPGSSGFGRLFTGRTVGPFGGVQWHTPLKGLSLQLEYDGNNYQSEGLGNRFDQASPINIGADYAVVEGVNLGVGYERGNTLMLRLNLHTNFQKNAGPPKTADPPPPPLRVRQDNPSTAVAAAAPAPGAAVASNGRSREVTVVEIDRAVVADEPRNMTPDADLQVVDATRKALSEQGFTLVAMNFKSDRREVEVWLRQDRYLSNARVIGRTARVLTRTLPDRYDQFTIIGTADGAEIYRDTVLRKDFELLAQDHISPEEMLHNTLVSPPSPGAPQAQFTGLAPLPKFSWDMGPAFRQQIGGPDGFFFGQLWWRVGADLQLSEHWNLSSVAGFNIVNNFDDITQQSNSQLPHVRSDIVKYLQQGQNGVVRLETNYIWSPYSQWYARFSSGLFEEMYGGVAGETLYRPFRQRWAVGLDANYVKQRGFNEQFDFRSYEVATGHLNFYYDFPWYGLRTKLSVGRYLARDYGTTIDVSREFRSGVVIGGFATFTNVPASEFGEGSFDKGVYISIPFDIFFNKSTRRQATFVFRPLTRDGGQKVRDGIDLYSATTDASSGASTNNWPDVAR